MALPQLASQEFSEWPVGAIDLQKLTQRGWRPAPIQQFIVKIHSRCNLACTYCYVYEKGDLSWQKRPRRMSEETVALAAARIGEHAAGHELKRVEVILHGGEPLLAGAEFIARSVEQLDAELPATTELVVTVQTNGILLTRQLLDAFSELGIRIGVSLDGTGQAHDVHRRYPDGRPSFDDVARGIRLLAEPAYRNIYAGLLCAIDLSQDPVAAYEALRQFEPPRMDFLLPHGNWTVPPPGRPADTSTPYADWLGPVFDHWYSATGERPSVRLFAEIIQLLIGGHSRSDLIGLSPAAVLVIETDGAIEQVDTLRVAYPGAPAMGLDVLNNSIDDAFGHPGVLARQIGLDALADECLDCRVQEICGGGFYGHRYRAGTGFRNRSVYCADLIALIDRIRATISSDLRRLRRPA